LLTMFAVAQIKTVKITLNFKSYRTAQTRPFVIVHQNSFFVK
ncbi:MAG: hypothetical protein ACI90R_001047, partial [Alteromonas macleodii]